MENKNCECKKLERIREKAQILENEKNDLIEELNKANELLNNIFNITFHKDYTLEKQVANDEIKYIHDLVVNYFEE